MLIDQPKNDIQKIENEIYELSQKLVRLRRDSPPIEVKNYKFKNLNGEVTLKDLFAGKKTLFAIHNMGQGCRYCTLWADGFNAFLPHLESQAAVVLMSKDSPETQQKFANDRHWRYRMVSHGGGPYMDEQNVLESKGNMPGIVCYELEGDKILRKNASVFGPHDQFCSLWHVLSLAGVDTEGFTPQYHYWGRPEKLDDGGKNVL